MEVGIDKSKETRQEYHTRVDIKDLQVYPYFWQTYTHS